MYKILTQTQEFYGCWLKDTIDEKYYGWKINCLALSQCLTLPQGILYSEPWHIQNPDIFRVLACSKPEVYWKPCQTSTTERFAKIVHGYNYFRNISFSRSVNIICFFKYFTPKVFILCKKVLRQSGAGVVSFDISEESVWDILSDKYKIFITF